jgi:hypothetical protein
VHAHKGSRLKEDPKVAPLPTERRREQRKRLLPFSKGLGMVISAYPLLLIIRIVGRDTRKELMEHLVEDNELNEKGWDLWSI